MWSCEKLVVDCLTDIVNHVRLLPIKQNLACLTNPYHLFYSYPEQLRDRLDETAATSVWQRDGANSGSKEFSGR
jgi:hypothetical protein